MLFSVLLLLASAQVCWVPADIKREVENASPEDVLSDDASYVKGLCEGAIEDRDRIGELIPGMSTETEHYYFVTCDGAEAVFDYDPFVQESREVQTVLTVYGLGASEFTGALVVQTTVTEFDPMDLTGYRYPRVWISGDFEKVTIRNPGKEGQPHKLAAWQFDCESSSGQILRQGGQPVHFVMWQALIRRAIQAGVLSGDVVVEAYEYSLVKGGVFDSSKLPTLERIVRYDGQSEQITTYSTVRVDFQGDLSIRYGKNSVVMHFANPDQQGDIELHLENSVQLVLRGIAANIDVTCEDGVTKDELIWTVFEMGNVAISGVWPEVEGLADIQSSEYYSYRSHRYCKEERVDGVSRTTCSRPPFMKVGEDSYGGYGSSIDVTLFSESVPFSFGSEVQSITLNSSDVHIQGVFWPDVKFQLNEDPTNLRIGALDPNREWTNKMQVSGGTLNIIADKCGGAPAPVPVTCVEMDLVWSNGAPGDDMKLAENGKIAMGYGFQLTDMQSLRLIMQRYFESAGEHVWTSFNGQPIEPMIWSDWKYFSDFLKQCGADLASAIQNTFISANGISVSGKTTLEIQRREVPLAGFYSPDPQPLVCLKKGEKVNLDDWTITWSSSIFNFPQAPDVTHYFPPFSDYWHSNALEIITQNGCECITYNPKNAPGSAFNIVFYVANQTMIEAFSGMSRALTVVSPSTIRQPVKLQNPNCKNVVVVCFDDVPNGRSIDLWDIGFDYNVFVVGMPLRPVYDGRIFKIIDQIMKIETEGDVWSTVYSIAKPLIDDYKACLPSVALKIHHLRGIYMCLCNYVGTSIDCELLVAGACNFGNIQQTEIKATCTVTDTCTYDMMRDKSFDTLVLVPVSISPPDYISVSSILFSADQWTLVGSGISNVFGKQEFKYSVSTKNVGQLYVLSTTDDLAFTIPTGSVLTSVKAVSVVMDIAIDSLYSSLPVSPLLSTDANNERLRWAWGSMARIGAAPKTTKFVGAWDKVQEVQGSFSVDAGSQPIEVRDVPPNVVGNLQVKSSQESTVNLPDGVKDLDVTVPEQLISGDQTLSYGAGIRSVKFGNITFKGGRAGSNVQSSLSLTISGQKQPLDITNIKCSDYSQVVLNDLTLSNSLDMGIGSQFSAPSAKYGDLTVTLHYTIRSLFSASEAPHVDVSKVPKKLVLTYDNDGSSFDMSPYNKKSAPLHEFTDVATCQNWLKVAEFQAENPNFAGSNNAVKAGCTDKTLVLTLQRIPEPTPTPALPEKPADPADGNKPPVGAIVGGVFGALVVIGAVVAVVIVVLRRKKQLMESSSSNFSNETVSTTAE